MGPKHFEIFGKEIPSGFSFSLPFQIPSTVSQRPAKGRSCDSYRVKRRLVSQGRNSNHPFGLRLHFHFYIFYFRFYISFFTFSISVFTFPFFNSLTCAWLPGAAEAAMGRPIPTGFKSHWYNGEETDEIHSDFRFRFQLHFQLFRPAWRRRRRGRRRWGRRSPLRWRARYCGGRALAGIRGSQSEMVPSKTVLGKNSFFF